MKYQWNDPSEQWHTNGTTDWNGWKNTRYQYERLLVFAIIECSCLKQTQRPLTPPSMTSRAIERWPLTFENMIFCLVRSVHSDSWNSFFAMHEFFELSTWLKSPLSVNTSWTWQLGFSADFANLNRRHRIIPEASRKRHWKQLKPWAEMRSALR